jgi:FAD/FMN-containing dehydrogenase
MSELVEALRRAGVPEVDDSRLRRSLYSSDASIYRVEPRAVVTPRHPDEVLATLAVCRDLAVPVTMRGAGTSIAGNAVGPGVVVDVSAHLNRVLDVDPDAGTALV